MVATDGSSLTPDTMRMWMGDFMTSIRVPAKCAARMGQCFSTTVQAGLVARLVRCTKCYSCSMCRLRETQYEKLGCDACTLWRCVSVSQKQERMAGGSVALVCPPVHIILTLLMGMKSLHTLAAAVNDTSAMVAVC